jgi:hypothetical protein
MPPTNNSLQLIAIHHQWVRESAAAAPAAAAAMEL